MRQFKHTQTGRIATEVLLGDNPLSWEKKLPRRYEFMTTTAALISTSIPADMIENSKDWEEIKEEKKPEWTILSFISKDKKIFYLCDNGSYGKNMPGWGIHGVITKESLLKRGDAIHSVRRESDGEVFTVGDKIYNDDIKIDNFTYTSAYGITVHYSSITPTSLEDGAAISFLDKSFVKKVKPKEWEITAYRELSSGNVFLLKKDGYYHRRFAYTKDDFADTERTEIYSVKRLSDGLEFKIGDKFKADMTDLVETVKGFCIWEVPNTNGVIACNVYGDETTDNIQLCTKIEKLFTTEDGVDIYEGDKSFWVGYNYDLREDRAGEDCGEYDFNAEFIKSEFCRAVFSTKKAAEEYILMNKPCLSVNNILDIVSNKGWNLNFNREDFIKLVQSKLKNES